MKALVGAFNQEKALVGAFSVIVQPVVEPMDSFTALLQTPAQPRQMAQCPPIVRRLMNQIVLWKVAGSISPNYFMTVYWPILILTVNIFVLATPNIFIREEQCDNKLNCASPSNQHHRCSLWHLWELYLQITMLLLLLQCYKYKYYSVFSQIDQKM